MQLFWIFSLIFFLGLISYQAAIRIVQILQLNWDVYEVICHPGIKAIMFHLQLSVMKKQFYWKGKPSCLDLGIE